MSILERKEREKEYRRRTIIDAAEKVFFSKGFEVATMQDIANEADLSKGTLYLYFKTKNEVCLAIYLRSLKIISSYLEKIIEEKDDAIEKILNFYKVFNLFIGEQPAYYMAILNYRQHGTHCSEDSKILKACIQQNAVINSQLINIIEEGKTRGSIKDDVESANISRLIWNNRTGILSNSVLIETDIASETIQQGKDAIRYFFKLMIEAIRSK